MSATELLAAVTLSSKALCLCNASAVYQVGIFYDLKQTLGLLVVD